MHMVNNMDGRRLFLNGCRNLLTLLLLSSCLFAQDVEFTIRPQTLRVGEVGSAEFRVRNAQVSVMPELPQIDGIQFQYRGQSMKSTFSTQGGSDRYISFTYSVIPLRPGDFTIGPFTYQYGSTQYGVPPVKVNVLPPGGSGPGSDGEAIDWNSLVFATMETKQSQIVNQEFIDVDFSIYHRAGIQLDNQIQPLQLPSTGLTIKEMQELGGGREQVHGELYDVQRFRIKFQAITEGRFTLAPALRVNLLSEARSNRRRGSLFDEFFGSLGHYEKHPVEIKPDPIQIVVRSLPNDGRPPSFNGAVGQFELSVQVQPQTLKEGDPVTVRTTISGNGNIDTVTAPVLNLGPDFRVYEAKLQNKEVNRSGSAGRKTFEQVLIPRSSDTSELPAIAFSFFDPEQNRYIERKTGPFQLTIAPSDQTAPAVLSLSGSEGSKANLNVVDLDIAYLKPFPQNWTPIAQSVRVPLTPSLLIHLLAPVLAGFAFFIGRERTKRSMDLSHRRKIQAPRKARAGLKAMQAALEQEDTPGFFESAYRCLADFYSDLYGWTPGVFTADLLLRQWAKENRPDEDISFIRDLLHKSELVRYGASAGKTPDEKTLEQITRIIRKGKR